MIKGNERNRLCPNHPTQKYKKCCWSKERDAELRKYLDFTKQQLAKEALGKKVYK